MDAIVYLVAFAVASAAGVFILYQLDLWNGDALARTVDAQNILFSRDPHLAAVGFIWPPIPTISRLPFLLFMRPLHLTEFVGPLSSIAFTAGAVVVLNRILSDMRLSPGARCLWIGLTLLNPVVLLHFTNGTAESAFTFLLLLVAYFAMRLEHFSTGTVLAMGSALAAEMWVRYEAVGLAAMVAFGVILAELMRRRSQPMSRAASNRLEAVLVTMLAPAAFVGTLWLFLNAIIQGDPLFFYSSIYSVQGAPDIAKNVPGHVLAYAYGSMPGTAQYVLQRMLELSPLFPIAVVGAALLGALRRDLAGLLLALVSMSTVVIQAYQAFTGSIPPWLRYWVYLPVLSAVVAAYIVNTPWIAGGALRRRIACWAIVPLAMVAGNALSLHAMTSPAVGVDERIFAFELLGRHGDTATDRAFYPDRQVAGEIVDYLRDRKGTVLVNLERATLLVAMIDDPSRLIVNSDRDFESVVQHPQGNADWILLPDPTDQSGRTLLRDAIYTQFPNLYSGAPWLKLEREFRGKPNWRLYAVEKSPS